VSSVLLDGDCPDGRRPVSVSSTQLILVLSCTSEFVFRFFAGESVSSSLGRKCLVPTPTLAGGTITASRDLRSDSLSPPGTLLAAVTAARNGFQRGGRCDCVAERPLTESEAEKQLVGCVRSCSLVSGTAPRSSDITVESGRRTGDCRLPDGDRARDCLVATLIGGS